MDTNFQYLNAIRANKRMAELGQSPIYADADIERFRRQDFANHGEWASFIQDKYSNAVSALTGASHSVMAVQLLADDANETANRLAAHWLEDHADKLRKEAIAVVEHARSGKDDPGAPRRLAQSIVGALNELERVTGHPMAEARRRISQRLRDRENAGPTTYTKEPKRTPSRDEIRGARSEMQSLRRELRSLRTAINAG